MTTTAERIRPEQAAVPHGDAVAPAPPHRFRVDIEGLRAVAVGLVLADHVFGWPGGGFIGVDVFFVISGFLITGLLVRERERTGRISFRDFYVRRARRLLPAAVATLGATTLAAWLLFVGGRFWDTATDALWALFFGANIRFAQLGTDYFQQTAAPSPVQHFWSLAVEEQFYLLWPALILVVFALPARVGGGVLGRRTVRLGVVVLGVCVASFLWSVHATADSPATAYFSTFTRAWELGLGALVAVATGLRALPAALRAALAWTGLAGVLVSAFLITSTDPFPGFLAAFPVVSAVLVVAFGAAPGGPGVRWALGSPPARFLGRISYSLYLWHWPVVVVCWSVLGATTLTSSLVAIGLSLLLATVSYHAVEQPVLHSRWLLGGRRVPLRPDAAGVFHRGRAVASAAVVVVVLTGAAVTIAYPPGRLDAQAVAAADAALAAAAAEPGEADVDPLTREILLAASQLSWPEGLSPSLDDLPGYLEEQWSGGCFDVGEWNVAQCRYGEATAPHRAVVLGDSIAGAWLPGLRAEMEPRGWSIQTLTMGQCPNIDAMTLYRGEPFGECADHRRWALDHIAATKPELVILSDTYDTELADREADKAAVWGAGLTSVVERVQQSGARVVLLTAPPSGANLQACATALNGPADCLEGPPARFRTQVTIEEQVARDTGAAHVDPERWFCADERCPAVVGNTPVFADGLHMTAEYSVKVGPHVVEAVLAPV